MYNSRDFDIAVENIDVECGAVNRNCSAEHNHGTDDVCGRYGDVSGHDDEIFSLGPIVGGERALGRPFCGYFIYSIGVDFVAGVDGSACVTGRGEEYRDRSKEESESWNKKKEKKGGSVLVIEKAHVRHAFSEGGVPIAC